MAAAARSVYEVRVIDPVAGETGNAMLLGGLITAVFGDMFGARARVKVEIVATETGESLVHWMSWPADAGLLREKIESDLDQLDADAFASEWGLRTPRSAEEDSG